MAIGKAALRSSSPGVVLRSLGFVVLFHRFPNQEIVGDVTPIEKNGKQKVENGKKARCQKSEGRGQGSNWKREAREKTEADVVQ
jgi:hypothetical protein